MQDKAYFIKKYTKIIMSEYKKKRLEKLIEKLS